MKVYALPLLGLLFFLFTSCEDQKKPKISFEEDRCEGFPSWDVPINNEDAALRLSRWQAKWTYPETSPYYRAAQAVPDSFFVYFAALEEFSIGHCGFRVYYGLTEPGKLSTLGLIITGINDHFGDVLDTVGTDNPKDIYFTTATRPNQILPDSLEAFNNFIDLETAQMYTYNWRCYNQVSRVNDTLGVDAFPCTVDRQIPPGGELSNNSDYRQRIPLGNAFGPSDSVFEKIIRGDEYHSFEAFILYNSIVLEDNIWMQDFYMRGYGQLEEEGPLVVGSLPIDITGHCPPVCNRENALQGN